MYPKVISDMLWKLINMTTELCVGDLLVNKGDIGIVIAIEQTYYGKLYSIHWKRNITTIIPEVLLTKSFWKRFDLVRAKT